MDRKLLPYENVFLLSLPFLKWNSQIISDLLLKHSPYKACNYLETILQAENFILCYPCSLLHQCVAFFFYLKSKFFQSTKLFCLVSAHFLTLKRSGCRNLYGTSIEMGMSDSGWSCILSWQLSLTACVMQSYSVFVMVSKKKWAQEECKLSQRQDQSSKWSQETGEVIWNQCEKTQQRELQGPAVKEMKCTSLKHVINGWSSV